LTGQEPTKGLTVVTVDDRIGGREADLTTIRFGPSETTTISRRI
jgi:hypothetical protein